MRNKIILVVGQVPPPYHGQAISTKRFLEGNYQNAELVHLNLSFSTSLDQVGKFQFHKILKLFTTVVKVIIYKLRFDCEALYYMPCGGQRVALYRDMIILLSTRWLFSKVIYHFRSAGLSIAYQDLTWIEKRLVKLAFGKPDFTIRLSEFNPEDGKFLGSKRDIIIPNGMEDHYRQGVKNQDVINILYIGSIRETKGVGELMQAISKLVDHGLKFKLRLAGKFHDEQFKGKVFDFVKSNERYVEYIGEINGEAKWDIFATTDLLVFPSYYENESFGLVTIEAMQFKIPVVATNWRAIPGIIQHQKSGLIVPIQNAETLAEAMQTLIVNPELRIKMGEYGRKEYLEKYSLERFYSNFEKLFLEM
ncbi:MAG: glycosyltransferase family 4 protein [Reichenbachiella sp.]|uniref:glycosyltransferase family 4 protein n=1 Tax=Reichenbachiella sp. TaxID=2184521 RepID=UPI0032669C17